jgi:hypothetical protein
MPSIAYSTLAPPVWINLARPNNVTESQRYVCLPPRCSSYEDADLDDRHEQSSAFAPLQPPCHLLVNRADSAVWDCSFTLRNSCRVQACWRLVFMPIISPRHRQESNKRLHSPSSKKIITFREGTNVEKSTDHSCPHFTNRSGLLEENTRGTFKSGCFFSS